ncbi:hypothetical protein ASF52_09480 [Methylobacterium sp. Leaf112]|nr:hypothetical protein ASF52_09480 [Methylobacterium sp. Leaf112]
MPVLHCVAIDPRLTNAPLDFPRAERHGRHAGSKQYLVGGVLNALLVVEGIGTFEKRTFSLCILQHDVPIQDAKALLFLSRSCNVLHGASEPALGDLLHLLWHQALKAPLC